jgi:hypothetical protein
MSPPKMCLLVKDVDAWHQAAQAVAAQFNVRTRQPEVQRWGMRDFTLCGPSGVLWRNAQNIPR